MNTLARLNLCLRQGVVARHCVTPVLFNRGFCDNPTDDSNEKEEKAKAAQLKLSSLLGQLKTVETIRKSPGRELNLSKPNPKRPLKRNKTGLPKSEEIDTSNLDPEVVEGVQAVAGLARTTSKKKRTESDLLRKLKGIAIEAEMAKKEDIVVGEDGGKDLSSLFSDIKVEKAVKETKSLDDKFASRSVDSIKSKQDKQKDLTMEQLAFLQKRQKLRRQQLSQSEQHTPIDLFGAPPLNIFSGPMVGGKVGPELSTWRACVQRELRIMSTPSPRNALEEMILWTEQGRLWQFPVDNEQGLDYSEDPFHKHVFLEHHLDPWCPLTGPVRHFMELVCIGLSKNPYVSSGKKLETILWFRNYFEREDNLEILVHGGFWEEQTAIPA